jgi:hypothetical protein
MDIEDVIAEARTLWLDAAEKVDFTRSNMTTFGTLYLRQRLSKYPFHSSL